ncbi:MAG: electron transport complex subunit RsxA [Clostridia bacterium]|nr:electron transport complex subunit RsxA [Clostridia bacterium]
MLKEILSIAIIAMLTQNFVLVRFYGICPFLGVSKKTDTALSMGMAVTFVMTIASMLTYLANHFLLEAFNISYLRTVVFILIIASIVQIVEMFLQKALPSLYSALGIYLPLITTNCAVLGVALLNVQNEYNFINSTIYGFFGGLGFTLAIVLFAGVRERLELSDIPEFLKGFPISLITAGLIAMAFLGFSGMQI